MDNRKVLEEKKDSTEVVVLMSPKTHVKESFAASHKSELRRWIWVLQNEELLQFSDRYSGNRTTVLAGCGGLQDNEGRMLLCAQKDSKVQPAGYQASHVDRLEEKKRFGATIPTTQERKTSAMTSVIHKKVDWKCYDGSVGDGECPSVSAVQVGGAIDCELDYEEENEDLEEGEILHWRN
ncbi:hypothetical protein NDU88_001482 [Pleurodeles waltl]|uniref:Uncharacterized protein n=1 Tax=Pleurodeles waltl TaxID=8319 RepID=A0AAV7Q387_PLEWA|nr:hypothetical protein NDU88_001482 [Pleurodeles waltl]